MNPYLAKLAPYPFERLARLKAGVTAPAGLPHIAMSIGEPQHTPPALVLEALTANLGRLGSYPPTAGLPELRAAAAGWLGRRFSLPPGVIDPDRMVVPVNGTREGLFAFVQAVVDAARRPLVAMPNPFYQIYEGAALLAGAQPYLIETGPATRYLPDLDSVPEDAWQRCALLFLCTPGNPTGAVMPRRYLEQALALAEIHDFVIASDECYCDLYLDEAAPPPGLLEVALASGRDLMQRCAVFHSLSKRSSVPGLRSGFIAGDPGILAPLLLYRTYHGCAMPLPTQAASIAAWSDDAHAAENRAVYREKFARVVPMLAPLFDLPRPDGAFYLWPDVGGDDERFTRELYAAQNVTVLPGSYLARDSARGNPGRGRVRISLVAGVADCAEAAERIVTFVGRRG